MQVVFAIQHLDYTLHGHREKNTQAFWSCMRYNVLMLHLPHEQYSTFRSPELTALQRHRSQYAWKDLTISLDSLRQELLRKLERKKLAVTEPRLISDSAAQGRPRHCNDTERQRSLPHVEKCGEGLSSQVNRIQKSRFKQTGPLLAAHAVDARTTVELCVYLLPDERVGKHDLNMMSS